MKTRSPDRCYPHGLRPGQHWRCPRRGRHPRIIQMSSWLLLAVGHWSRAGVGRRLPNAQHRAASGTVAPRLCTPRQADGLTAGTSLHLAVEYSLYYSSRRRSTFSFPTWRPRAPETSPPLWNRRAPALESLQHQHPFRGAFTDDGRAYRVLPASHRHNTSVPSLHQRDGFLLQPLISCPPPPSTTC